MSTVMVCFHPTEFAALLKISGFNLPANVIIKLVKEADVNGDALIQYRGSLIQKASKSKRAHARKAAAKKKTAMPSHWCQRRWPHPDGSCNDAPSHDSSQCPTIVLRRDSSSCFQRMARC